MTILTIPAQFTIYISGASRINLEFVALYRAVCEAQLHPSTYTIAVVDLQSDPAAAEHHAILALPTIIRDQPMPTRKVVGRFSAADAAAALQFLTQDLTTTNT